MQSSVPDVRQLVSSLNTLTTAVAALGRDVIKAEYPTLYEALEMAEEALSMDEEFVWL